MFAIFLKSLIIGYSGAMMPGPMFTYTVDKSMRFGVKAGILVSMGHVIFESFLVMLIFLGAGKFLDFTVVRAAIGFIGGLVLAYLGFGMIKEVYLDRISLDPKEFHDRKQGNMLIAGAVLSISNPYFIIWWSAVGLTLIMSSYVAYGIAGITVFYIGHMIADISWFTFVAALISKTRHLINIKLYKGIIIALGVCLIGFGVRFFISAIGYLS